MRNIEEGVAEAYGFVPRLTSSYHSEAQRVMGDTLPGFYFKSPKNLAFHDLTTGRSLPPATEIVMGLGTKFIPVPASPTSRKKSIEAFERLEREVHRKVFFSGSPSDFDLASKSKLYVKSTWIPPLPPPIVNTRLYQFQIILRRLFYKRKGRSNFTHFQEKIFRKL